MVAERNRAKDHDDVGNRRTGRIIATASQVVERTPLDEKVGGCDERGVRIFFRSLSNEL